MLKLFKSRADLSLRCHIHQTVFGSTGPGGLVWYKVAVVWMFVSPQNSYVEILTPKVMVLAGGGVWEVIGLWGGRLHEWD